MFCQSGLGISPLLGLTYCASSFYGFYSTLVTFNGCRQRTAPGSNTRIPLCCEIVTTGVGTMAIEPLG